MTYSTKHFGEKEMDWLDLIGIFFCIYFGYNEHFVDFEFYSVAAVAE